MKQISQILRQLRSRNGLIAIAVLLAVLNIGRLAISKYDDIMTGIQTKRALLDQYQTTTLNLGKLKKRLKELENRQRQFDARLFTGNSAGEITSAMQIKLQDILHQAGLSPESLRPSYRSNIDRNKIYGEVLVKIRLTGRLKNIVKFLALVYRSNYFLKIDNFTFKTFRNDQLKVFFAVKGFYRIARSGAGDRKVRARK
ncbi:GspMb/PilO family protein [Desulfobacterota bacterium M19]